MQHLKRQTQHLKRQFLPRTGSSTFISIFPGFFEVVPPFIFETYTSCLCKRKQKNSCHTFGDMCGKYFAFKVGSVKLKRQKIMMMTMMMMNCFCRMVEWWKAFGLIFSSNHCQRFSPLQISDKQWAAFEPELRLCWMKLWSSDNYYTTAPQMRHIWNLNTLQVTLK